MTVRLTSEVFGQAVGTTFTGTAEEETWAVENGYAHVEPKVAVDDQYGVTPDGDLQLAVNREDANSTEGEGRGYVFGTDAVDPLPSQVYDVTPEEGPAAGGTVVTLVGDDFTNATAVNFGANPGTDFALVSDDEIEVTTPAGTADTTVDVTVVDADGNGVATAAFTYTA